MFFVMFYTYYRWVRGTPYGFAMALAMALARPPPQHGTKYSNFVHDATVVTRTNLVHSPARSILALSLTHLVVSIPHLSLLGRLIVILLLARLVQPSR